MTSATVSAPAAPATPGAGRDRRWLALAVIGVAQLMIILDASIVNIALPHAQKALHISDASRRQEDRHRANLVPDAKLPSKKGKRVE